MKLILKLKDVPEGATVATPTGKKRYVVHDKIAIYDATSPAANRISIAARDGTRFLVALHGSAYSLCEFLEELAEREEQEDYDS